MVAVNGILWEYVDPAGKDRTVRFRAGECSTRVGSILSGVDLGRNLLVHQRIYYTNFLVRTEELGLLKYTQGSEAGTLSNASRSNRWDDAPFGKEGGSRGEGKRVEAKHQS